MKFDKNMLDTIKFICLVLENCEDFEIAADDILDFQTSEIRMGAGYYGENEVDDGRLVISKRAFKNLSSMATQEYTDGTTGLDYDPEEVFYLYNRLIGYCNICQVHVKFKDGKDILFFVPYDPLVSRRTGGEVDLSNCSSAELDGNGDLLILFGTSSHSYKRTDDNYFDLVIGLKDEIKKPLKNPLQIMLMNISNNQNDSLCPRFFLSAFLANNGYSRKKIQLVFEDVRDLSFDIDFEEEGKRHLRMSRISTGDIFVEIENLCEFYCHGAKTYSRYAGERDDLELYENKEIYREAIHCELNERQMALFAGNHYGHTEKEFDMAVITAAGQKVLRGEISVKYFMNWLKAHSEMFQFYRTDRLKSDELYCTIATMMDRLQIKLSYYENLPDCRTLIEKSLTEIENVYKAARATDAT